MSALGTPPFVATTLARTAPDDIGKVRRDQALTALPAPGAPSQGIAWALTFDPDPRGATRNGARLAVFASRAIASDAWLGEERLANADLLVDCARWLAGRGPAEDIPPLAIAAYRVDAEPGTLHLLLAALVAIAPSALVGAAILAWWERR